MTVEKTSKKKSKNAKATAKESPGETVRLGTIENWRETSKQKPDDSKRKPKKPQKSPLRGG